ncbi:MAG: LysE family transporter, partial [Pseudomonadota bacterium]
ALSDAILIAAGVAGFAVLVERFPALVPVMTYGGAAFLIVYGALAFRSALRGGGALRAADQSEERLLPVLLTCLALTWLNPHVYLDTVVLLGAYSTGFEGAKLAFAAGAMTASFVFFFALGYGARLLAPFFERPSAWRMLDFGVALVMWGLAAKLLLG